jgi:hypothetical protein
VGVWTGAADEDHVYTVGAYMHYGGRTKGPSNGRLKDPSSGPSNGPASSDEKKGSGWVQLLGDPEARDLSPSATKGDPLYAVYATRLDTRY